MALQAVLVLFVHRHGDQHVSTFILASSYLFSKVKDGKLSEGVTHSRTRGLENANGNDSWELLCCGSSLGVVSRAAPAAAVRAAATFRTRAPRALLPYVARARASARMEYVIALRAMPKGGESFTA